jgi:hypothetical protein
MGRAVAVDVVLHHVAASSIATVNVVVMRTSLHHCANSKLYARVIVLMYVQIRTGMAVTVRDWGVL